MYECIKNIKEKKMQKIDNEIFLVSEKHILKARNGDSYIGLKLKDKSGVIDAKIWNNLIHLGDRFNEGDFVKVKGESNYYNESWQIIIKDIEKLKDSGIDKTQFLPSTSREIDVMKNELFTLINTVKNQSMKKLLLSIFEDEDFLEKFCIAPAAKAMHHAYVGGLLEHTVSVGKIAKEMGEYYKDIDMDLLISCALCHDIGKVYELDPVTFNYTTQGKLIGHIMIGYTIVQNKIEQLNILSKERAMNLLHCILSHHGEYEYGSPKKPKTKEAVLFNLIDVLDSRMQPVVQASVNNNSGWSEMVKIIGKSIYAPKKTNELFK
jgi:3'-5' exoribonuclease